MLNNYLLYALLAALLGLALAYDIGRRRIPNWLVVAGLIAGLGYSLFSAWNQGASAQAIGVEGLGKPSLGAATGLLIMLPSYLLRAMGAGDAKLMAAIGAFLGPLQITGAALLTFVAGGVLALLAALGGGSLARVLGNLKLMGMVAVSGAPGLKLSDVQTTGRLPYAIAIAIGTGLQLWLAKHSDWPFV